MNCIVRAVANPNCKGGWYVGCMLGENNYKQKIQIVMKHFFLFTAFMFFTCLSFAQPRNLRLVKAPTENPVVNQTRKAVVIGMGDYGGDKSLNNTINDANDMADVLTQLGFEVTLLKNNDLRNLRANLTNWYNTIEGNDMAVFYFAGHGMEVNGENYLVPIDADLNSQTDVEDYTLKVNNVLGNMNEKQVKMKLLILDACRDNPFRSWTRGSEEKGLAQMSAPKGTYIAFAASPGRTSQDGENYNLHNGVFTYYLKQEIIKEGLSIDEIFNNVTGDVSTLTNDQQTPFKNSSLTRNFYFIPTDNKSVANNNSPIPAPDNSQKDTPTPINSDNKHNGDVYNPDGIELVWVEGTGTTKGFYIGKYELTQAQWKTIMGDNPSSHKGDNLPVNRVDWTGAEEFISQLNAKTGRNYRLPTEAEWEFAARGGTKSHGYKYSGSDNADDVAWYLKRAGGITFAHPVGTKSPNELGIYDMSGNVWEWCEDFGADGSPMSHMLHGGSKITPKQYCNVDSPGYSSCPIKPLINGSNYLCGFRVVLPE